LCWISKPIIAPFKSCVPASRATTKFTGNQMLGFFAELMAYFETVGEIGDPAEANQLLAVPETTLDDWLKQMTAGPVRG